MAAFLLIVFGIFVAMFLYGKKAVIFFIAVCGLTAIPFGLLIDLPNDDYIFAAGIAYGASAGLAVGLYNHRTKSSIISAVVIIVICTIAISEFSYLMNK